jgi:hypothetical protein
MSTALLLALILIPLGIHVLLTAVVYYDVEQLPLEQRKWTLIAGAIPLFGFFMYLFERSELDYDPSEDPYASGGYNVHPSRADDFPLSKSGEDRPPTEADMDESVSNRTDAGTDREPSVDERHVEDDNS